MSTESTIPLQDALNAVQRLADAVKQSTELIQRLSLKRVTLEEKMIRRYFHEFASLAGQLIAHLHTRLLDGATVPPQRLRDLNTLLDEVCAQLDEILKIVAYDLNFLEQYFEHGFYSKLVNEYLFINRAQEIFDGCKYKAQNDAD